MSYRIHTHSAGELGIFVNAYLVEGARGVVAVDATLTMSDSRAFRRRLDDIGKPLLAVLITHGHPDHVAGLTQLVAGLEVPIVALESVAAMMRVIEEPKRAQWEPIYHDEWVPKWTYPNRLVKDKDVVEFDGMRFRIFDMGPGGDCDANGIWLIENEPKVAFIGDLVFNGTHPYMADGHIADWLTNLERAASLLTGVKTLYPGHGAEGSLDLLKQQRERLLAYRQAVQSLADTRGTLTESEKNELTQRMQAQFPNAKLPFLIAHSADAVAAELAEEAKKGTAGTRR